MQSTSPSVQPPVLTPNSAKLALMEARITEMESRWSGLHQSASQPTSRVAMTAPAPITSSPTLPVAGGQPVDLGQSTPVVVSEVASHLVATNNAVAAQSIFAPLSNFYQLHKALIHSIVLGQLLGLEAALAANDLPTIAKSGDVGLAFGFLTTAFVAINNYDEVATHSLNKETLTDVWKNVVEKLPTIALASFAGSAIGRGLASNSTEDLTIGLLTGLCLGIAANMVKAGVKELQALSAENPDKLAVLIKPFSFNAMTEQSHLIAGLTIFGALAGASHSDKKYLAALLVPIALVGLVAAASAYRSRSSAVTAPPAPSAEAPRPPAEVPDVVV